MSETPDPAVTMDWSGLGDSQHLVQFYEDDAFLVAAIGRFVSLALAAGDGVVSIATRAHEQRVAEQLSARGVDLRAARERGQYVALDAADVLAQIVVDGVPDEQRFRDVVGGVLCSVGARHRRVRAFGEMVALLWADGNSDGAIRLERLWNDLAKVQSFALCCAYPINGFSRRVDGAPFLEVCAEHSHVVPAESYLTLTESDERFRSVARLQQKLAENEALMAELAETARRKDEFLAMLGHELRNPLSPILAAVEILQVPHADAPALRTAQCTIRRQVRNLARIVDDLLDVSRITRGKIRLESGPVDLTAVLAHSVESARPLIDAKGHRISTALPATPLPLEGDATRLGQVFTNLLTNSAKYMDDPGPISLTASIVGSDVAVSVHDSGIGMDAELLPRVFDLFTQADHSLDRSRGGLGIGLWMARKIVELHGGTIQAHSAGLGKGSSFIVILPLDGSLDRPVAAPASWESREVETVPKQRILVVDDNRDAAEVLAIRLRMSGHEVHVAHDGLVALRAATTQRPDVVLLDIGLPGLDGYAVARRLRQTDRTRSMRLIAVTGYGSEADRRRTREAGFDHHFVKPVEPAELSELLARPLPRPPRARRTGLQSDPCGVPVKSSSC